MTTTNADRPLLNQSKYARHRKVSRKTVTDWKNKGLLVLNGLGLVDVTATDAALDARPPTYRGGNTTSSRAVTGNVDPAPVGNTPDPADFGFDDPNLPTAEAIRRKENFLGLLRKHELAVACGTYVRKTDVVAHIAGAFTGLRRQMQSMPSRHVPEMAARLGIEPGTLTVELDRMIHTTLAEMSAPVMRT